MISCIFSEFYSNLTRNLFFPNIFLFLPVVFLCVDLTAQYAINKVASDSESANEFSKYLGGMNQHLLSRKRRSGLAPCTEKCDPLSLAKESIPGSEVTGYRIIRKELTWKEAHDECEENHGHLASFLQERTAKQVSEAIFLKSKYDEDYDWNRRKEEFGLDRRYWIGLTDMMEEGRWAWAGKGQLLTYQTMWYPNQPDHVYEDGKVRSGRRQHCVSLWNPIFYKIDKDKKPVERHTWDDLECDWKLYAICEDDPDILSRRKSAAMNGRGLISDDLKAQEEKEKAEKLAEEEKKKAEEAQRKAEEAKKESERKAKEAADAKARKEAEEKAKNKKGKDGPKG